MTYLLQWRNATPKGNPGKVDQLAGLDTEEVRDRLPKLLASTCWIHVQREDLKFAGKSTR